MALLRVVHSGISYLLQTPTRNTITWLHTCNLRACENQLRRRSWRAAKPGRSFNADVAEGLRRTGKRGAHWITQQTLAGLLSEFLLCRNATESATQLLLLADSGVKGLAHSYICKKPCFATLDKLLTLKQKMAQLNQEMKGLEDQVDSSLVDLYHLQPREVIQGEMNAISPKEKQPRARRSLDFHQGKSPSVTV